MIKIEDMNASQAVRDTKTNESEYHQVNTVASLSCIGGGQIVSISEMQPLSILKPSTRIAPGVLSNNTGQSHLMKFVNKEHQLKV